MKRDISQLKEEISIVLGTPYADDKKRFKKVQELMAQHGISRGRTRGMLSLSLHIYDIEIAEAYLFTKYLYQVTNKENINPELFFTEEEVKLYELYKIDNVNVDDDLVAIFHNVDQVSSNQWICTSESYIDIVKKFEQNMITYNPRTQRGLVFNNKILTPDIREKAVNQIAKKMLEGQFTPNMITLNIRKTDKESVFDYDEKTRTIRVFIDNEDTFLDIPDGMHRSKGMMVVAKEDPNTKMFTIINILNYTEAEVRQYINQEATHTPISAAQKKAFDTSNAYVEITKNINKKGSKLTNELQQKIFDNYNEMQYRKGYTTVALFSTAIEQNFVVETAFELAKVEDFLIVFFNHLFGMLREKYKTQNIERLDLFTQNILVGFIAWASQLQKDIEWQVKLHKLVNLLDLTDENKELVDVGIKFVDKNGKQTEQIVRKISKYFKEMIKHV